MRLLALLFVCICSFQALGEPLCPPKPQGFEAQADLFLKNFKDEPDACDFELFSALTDKLIVDMLYNPQDYNQKMKALAARPRSEALEYLFLGAQEAWFNIFLNQVLDRESKRMWATLTDWRVLTGGALLVGMAMTKPAKNLRTKFIRFVKRGLKYVLQRRPYIALGSGAGSGSNDSLSIGDGKIKPVEFVHPPLFFLNEDDSRWDSRTDGVYIDNIVNDLWEIGAGVGAGTIAGVGAGHVAAKKLGWTSWSVFFKDAKWPKGKIASIAHPAFMVGFVVTYFVTDWTSDWTESLRYQLDFKRLRREIQDTLAKLEAALKADHAYEIWYQNQRLRNTLVLYRFWLTQDYTAESLAEIEAGRARILGRFAACLEKRETILKDEERILFRKQQALVKTWDRNLRGALSLSQQIETVLLANPNKLTDNLLGFVRVLKNEDMEKLSVSNFAVEWNLLKEQTENAEVGCVQPNPYLYMYGP